MANETYKTIEITGTSDKSQDAAIANAIATASKTVEDLRWFQVIETRGLIDSGRVAKFQVTLKIGFHIHE